jgi:hypothetical protein
MKNKILLGLVAISVGLNIILLAGCDGSQSEASSSPKKYRMVEAGSDSTDYFGSIKGKLVVDTQTNVEYWYIEPKAGEGGSYSLTLLVDQDGKPLVWKGE